MKSFTNGNPSLDEYEKKLRYFGMVEREIDNLNSIQVIGALSLNSSHIKAHLKNECNQWKLKVRSILSNICPRSFETKEDAEPHPNLLSLLINCVSSTLKVSIDEQPQSLNC